MRSIFLYIVSFFLATQLLSQDSLRLKPQIDLKLSVSPSMLSLGILDAGVSSTFTTPIKGRVSLLVNGSVRNNWFKIPMTSVGMDTRSLKSSYNISTHIVAGLAYTFFTKTDVMQIGIVNGAFYHTYREKVQTDFINEVNTQSILKYSYGLMWRSHKINPKKKNIAMEFFLPLGPQHFLDGTRNLSISFGIIKPI